MKKAKKPFDFWIFLTVLLLLSLGLIMVFSASGPMAENQYHDMYHFVKRQLAFAVIGFIAMFAAMNFDYRKLGKLSPLIVVVSIVLLILVFIPGIGGEKKGTYRWLDLGFTQFQPSEIAKLAIILFFSYSLSKKKDPLNSFFKGLLPYLLLLGLFVGLILLERHMSATIIVISVAAVILFAAGARIKHFIILGVPVVAGLAAVIFFTDYMTDRILSYLHPFEYKSGIGWQTVQSLYAIGSGGLFGRGLGRSLQKFLYLPEPHNDFIFPVLAEELGFIGVLAVMLLYLIFIWRGIKVAMNAPDTFGSLVALGITSLIAIQSLFNIAVVTNTVPPTGVSLPFFSYGGTSLLVLMTEVGILLNISKYSNYERI
ncbi:MAG TPA: putative lipid II flippase FtsW [Clostridiaceae bacterium]|nr:putative lipid II flippase FtsW [Clostridiaceae bacterium]